MIHIEQGQPLFEHKNLRVKSATGDYADSDLIKFYDIKDTSNVYGSYQAQYVKYGGLVYKFNDPKELGEAILKIDPESTHDAAVFVRMSNQLLEQMNGGTMENVLPESPVVPVEPQTEEDEPVVPTKKAPRKVSPKNTNPSNPTKNIPISDTPTKDVPVEPTKNIPVAPVVPDVIEKTKEAIKEISVKKSALKKLATYTKKKAIKKFLG